LKNGGQLVALAGGMTAAVFLVMATIATVVEARLQLLGQVPVRRPDPARLVRCSLICFLQIPALAVTLSAIGVLIFSGFLLYDVQHHRSRRRNQPTSWRRIRLFLDLLNLFLRPAQTC